MTTLQETHTEPEPVAESQARPLVSPETRVEAEAFINALAAVAGDGQAVYDALRDFCTGQKVEEAFGTIAAAALLIFSECITAPVEPGEYAPLIYPDNSRSTTDV